MIRKHTILAAAAVLSLIPFAGTASAADAAAKYVSEVQACVTEIGRHANYDDARRVRHTVVVLKQSRARFVFAIDTSVFTDSEESAARQYTTRCITRGDGTPLKFEIQSATA